ncbi:MAG: hypothetical protein EXS05_13660 [Planctomycetaceae bacterium]|nr:hypothetical protein [Planctomycetaceae bacterium]
MVTGYRLLVVDQFTETTDVLRAVLEPRGVAVERSGSLATISDSASSPRISLIVVDEDSAARQGAGNNQWGNVPRIVIGTMGRPGGGTAEVNAAAGTCERRLRKPFQYADLLREIESLIALRAA